jgi:hypothetical protein
MTRRGAKTTNWIGALGEKKKRVLNVCWWWFFV